MPRRSIIAAFMALALVSTARVASAQQHHHDTRQFATLPLAVDGAATPDRIPDAIAFRHFIVAAATEEVPSRIAKDRQGTMIAAIGFGPADRNAFVGVMTGLLERLDDLDRRIADGARTGDMEELASSRRSKHLLLDATAQRLRASLSWDGKQRLQTYVQSVKRDIKIYGELP